MPTNFPATINVFCFQIDQDIARVGRSIDELIDIGIVDSQIQQQSELAKTCQAAIELDLILGTKEI